MRGIGCFVVLVIGFVAGWLLRDVIPWGRVGLPHATHSESVWQPITSSGAARTKAALDRLGQPRGPLFENLRAGDVASYVFSQLARQLPPSIDSVEAAAIGTRLYVRGIVRPTELGVTSALGPLAGILGERERAQFGGQFRILRPGLAEFRVEEIKVHEFALPTPLIPRVLQRSERGSRPQGLDEDALPLLVPPFIGDVRVSGNRVTLYKANP
ncbi:MAG: hypothetical protein NVS4B3_00580 [Gemmatimonadaceae bacterium]